MPPKKKLKPQMTVGEFVFLYDQAVAEARVIAVQHFTKEGLECFKQLGEEELDSLILLKAVRKGVHRKLGQDTTDDLLDGINYNVLCRMVTKGLI